MGRARLIDVFWVLLTGGAAVFLALSPIGASAATPAGPNWLLVVLGYWCARRPSSVAPIAVFALGLMQDLLRAGPVGAELFALLVICEGLRGFSAGRPPLSFLTEWMRFTAALLAYEAIVLALLTATYAEPPPIEAVGQRVGLSILVYPLTCYVLEKLFRARGRDGRFDHLRF